MYIAYKCLVCGKSFILVSEEVRDQENKRKYLTCPYDGRHKHIEVEERYSNLKECMEGIGVFKRIDGKIKQIR